MPKMLEVSSRSPGVNQRSNPYSLYGSETWWVGMSSDAENVGGHLKVIKGHPRSNPYSFDVWKCNLVGWDVIRCRFIFLGQFKVIRGHPRSKGLPMLYGLDTWWVESSPDAENIEGKFKVNRGHPRSNPYSLTYRSETCWVGISSDAENVGGQFKVIRGQPMSNDLPTLYGLETWWVESSLDAEII